MFGTQCVGARFSFLMNHGLKKPSTYKSYEEAKAEP